MAKTAGRPPRSESDIVEFRSKIAKHALAIYRSEGFGAFSMRRLAKEVGCAPMTIYAHFEGKQDILTDISQVAWCFRRFDRFVGRFQLLLRRRLQEYRF